MQRVGGSTLAATVDGLDPETSYDWTVFARDATATSPPPATPSPPPRGPAPADTLAHDVHRQDGTAGNDRVLLIDVQYSGTGRQLSGHGR